jgi:hypothetical protein
MKSPVIQSPKPVKMPSVKPMIKKDIKPENNNSISEKPIIGNMGLPEGSAIQPTGQRRPLIVYPK